MPASDTTDPRVLFDVDYEQRIATIFLINLIAVITNLAFYQRFSFAEVVPAVV